MKQNLKNIQDLIQQNNQLTEQDKEALLNALKDADKQWNITDFKLERTEKVKRTTAILLEETIEELEQKRKAVEAQNRKLEIETSLERVRTQAMGMHKLEQLIGVCEALYIELKTLGFNNIRNAQIAINNDENGFYLNYEYSYSYSGVIEVFYNSHPNVQALVNEMKKSKDAFFEIEIAGDALDEWRTWRINSGETRDPLLDNAAMLCYYFYSVGAGALGISTFDRITIEELNILKRFRNVFELAYRRYSDIEKAEAQAREAQIEAALERVRSKVMTMSSSKDLNQTSLVFGEQLRKLGINWQFSYFWLIEEDRDDNTFWITWPDNQTSMTTYSLAEADESFRECIIAWRQQVKIHSSHVQDVQAWLDTFERITHDAGGAAMEIMKPGNFKDGVYYYDAMIKYGSFGICTNRAVNEEEKNIQSRFAVEFERAYTRFLDLQNAEGQAREAKIEAALERIRTRSMAMHKSDEFIGESQVLFQELKNLGIETLRTGIGIIDGTKNTVELWSRVIGVISADFHPVFDNMINGWKENRPFISINLEGDEVKEYYEKLASHLLYHEQKEYNKHETITSFFFSQGSLNVISLEPLKENECDIMIRFARVFGQMFKRFLDLQKAEAQAREAHIEASLERVRSKTMAMHNSQDVGDTVVTMFEELVKLEVQAPRCGIIIIDDSKRMEVWTANSSPHGKASLVTGHLDMTIRPELEAVFNAWKNKESTFSFELVGEDLKDYFRAINNAPDYPIQYDIESLGSKEIRSDFFFPEGSLFTFTPNHIPASDLQIFKRFAGVFGQTYRRFLDLQKAEAQARESQIELGLERVRARAMAMQSSNELSELVDTVFKELTKLHFNLDRCIIIIMDENSMSAKFWMANPEVDKTPTAYNVLLHELPYFIAIFNAWKERKIKWVYDLKGEEKSETVKYIFSKTELRLLPEAAKKGMMATERIFLSSSYGNFGSLQADTIEPLSEENLDILYRFGKVFDLTYTRFNDLKQAEAQAREAKIELALERVRARTMAMQKSDELAEAAQLLYHEFGTLGINTFTCGYMFIDEAMNTQTGWFVLPDGTLLPNFIVFPLTGDHVLNKRYLDWKEKKPLHIFEIQGEVNKEHHRFLSKHVPPFIIQDVFSRMPDRIIFYCANFSEGYLLILSTESFSQDEEQTIIRFAKVFEMTYTRFLDLKKAEAQAREAQIEASLERVRAKAMAMHKSEDLNIAVATVFEELDKLDLGMARCGIAILDKEKRSADVFTTSISNQGNAVNVSGDESIDIHPLLQGAFDAWLKQTDFSYELAGKDLAQYYHAVGKTNIRLPDSQIILSQAEEIKQYFYVATFQAGCLFAFRDTSFSEEAKKVMKRFADVFNLTYTRFLDLQKAEAQAREATIEAALEKVRGKAMAMHNSNDLTSTASMVFTELRKLGINSIRCGVGLLTKSSRKALWYAATAKQHDDSLSLIGENELSGHPEFDKQYESWLNNENYFTILRGEELKSYYAALYSKMSHWAITDIQNNGEEYAYYFSFSVGVLYSWTNKPYSENEINILNRFKAIIDLTFRRYMELQKSEANAREAVMQAALDRVRAEIASMRTTGDLERITPLIWNELSILDIPFIRCGVFIMDEAEKLIHTFLSTPDGKAIAAFHIPYDTPGNISQVLSHWRDKETYIDHWDESAFTEFAGTLVKQGVLTSPDQYLSTLPRGGFYLHFLPFLQGMLYVGNTTQLGEDEIKLLQSVADAFSTAYARYEDFNKLEAAKQQVDKTLVDLKQAQQQLVQSEKMASLGELTAGIAHEIQNPLNFVNNFSEVSNELLDEMINELGKNNKEDAIAIADDVKQNLEKILHHGKRADGIVKGMLQHSRSSAGQKELTDINILADEYLRLAYHGLRAKDKSFNAKFETDFDPSIEKINVMPQEIGRVILNLINNAFYAVTEKKKQNGNARLPNLPTGQAGGQGYEPTVIICTMKLNNKIVIKVKDNGNGVPQKVMDKIFQPFFTTKPTGQGTGLGLSLSYDIVKAHGGDLKVETQEGKGAEFIIMLPTN